MKLFLIAVSTLLLSSPASSFAETCVDPVSGQRMKGRPFPWFGSNARQNRNAGKCLSTHATPMEVTRELGGDVVHLSGVTHWTSGRQVHGVAVVPLRQARDLIFQMERFPPERIAAHTQVRVSFPRRSIKWYASPGDLTRGKIGDRLSDLVFSVEAWWVQGDEYSLLRGTKNHFTMVFRGVSLESKVQSMIREKEHTVEQWKLTATPHQIEQFIRGFADRSQEASGKIPYHTVRVNCTTEPFSLLESVLNQKIRTPLLPVRSFRPMERAGIVQERLPNLTGS
ncbi:MAG: DUF4105 domain-containing protein [Verrucomicrobiota bacterium]